MFRWLTVTSDFLILSYFSHLHLHIYCVRYRVKTKFLYIIQFSFRGQFRWQNILPTILLFTLLCWAVRISTSSRNKCFILCATIYKVVIGLYRQKNLEQVYLQVWHHLMQRNDTSKRFSYLKNSSFQVL
jgi:hypothetical protein